ncbi:MAG: hypothetical protein ACTHNN_13785 [Xanthobacteraceae bacterium]
MKMLRAAVIFALFATPALAQNVNLIPETPSKTPEQIEQDKQLQREYRDSLRKIPDAKTSNDPWGSVRSAETPASAPRAKPKAKPRSASHQQ